MSKNKDKLNTSSNTLFNYFAKSPATTPKLKPSGSSSGGGDGTPKGIKQEKVTPSPARKQTPKKEVENGDEDEIQPMKKRRRIIMDDDSSDDGGGADSESENKVKNEKTPPKKSDGGGQLNAFKRVETVKGESPAQKKIKLEVAVESAGKELPEVKEEEEDGPGLEEPTIWLHQKLDFLKPDKIKLFSSLSHWRLI